MAERKTLKATCLCGNAAHSIALPATDFPLKIHMCHCDSCRHMTGALCLTVVFLPESYQPEQALVDKLHPFQFSKRITQYFCPDCGTHVLARCLEDENDPNNKVTWDVASGTLEQIEGLVELAGHEFLADTLDGGFSDFLPELGGKSIARWPQQPGKDEQLPQPWTSHTRPSDTPKPSDKLHAHCKCGGVSFYISRPSARSKEEIEADWPDLIIPEHSQSPRPPQETWWLADNGTKFTAGMCTCDSCRLAFGMEWVEWAFVPTADISLDEEGRVPFQPEIGTLKQYNSSSGVTRYFCGHCGAHVFWWSKERPRLIDVAVGLLAAPEGARAENWLRWRTQRVSYREDAMPRAKSWTEGVERGLKEYGRRFQGLSD